MPETNGNPTVSDGSATYLVRFQYDIVMSDKFTHTTKAFLYRTPRQKGDVPVAIGSTLCSKKDKFERVKGRKVALARAFFQLSNSKEVRTRLWASVPKSLLGL